MRIWQFGLSFQKRRLRYTKRWVPKALMDRLGSVDLNTRPRPPAQIRIRLRVLETAPVVDALERLADAGRIDRRSLDTKARKRGGGNYVIRQYRRHPGKRGR